MFQSVLGAWRMAKLFCLLNTLCIVCIHIIIGYRPCIIARCLPCRYGSYLYNVFCVLLYICIGSAGDVFPVTPEQVTFCVLFNGLKRGALCYHWSVHFLMGHCVLGTPILDTRPILVLSETSQMSLATSSLSVLRQSRSHFVFFSTV